MGLTDCPPPAGFHPQPARPPAIEARKKVGLQPRRAERRWGWDLL